MMVFSGVPAYVQWKTHLMAAFMGGDHHYCARYPHIPIIAIGWYHYDMASILLKYGP